MEVHRQMKVEQYLTLLRRRSWLLLITAIFGGGAGFVLSRVMPPQYTSHAMVLVEEPVVTDNEAKPVVNEDLNQRLASMQEQILSRARGCRISWNNSTRSRKTPAESPWK